MKGLFAQLRDDAVHLGDGVREVFFEARAEVVQARLAVHSADDAVLWAFAPAVGEIGALAAKGRQGFVFGVAEFDLGAGKGLGIERAVLDVAHAVFRVHIVVAGIHAAIVFDGQALPQNSL